MKGREASSMGTHDDAMPELAPGNSTEIVRDGHVMHVTATRHDAFHTGRRLYSVECLTCKILVHPTTTGPEEQIEYHLRHPADAWPG